MANDSEYDFSRIDIGQLPSDVRAALDDLEQEFRDLDITEKGYLKKKIKLLAPFAPPPAPPADVHQKPQPCEDRLGSGNGVAEDQNGNGNGNNQLSDGLDEAMAIGALHAAIDSAEADIENEEIIVSATNEAEIEAEPEPEDVTKRENEQSSMSTPAEDAEREALQRRNRRVTRRQDNRYHSEIRQEAVMKALELYKQLQNQIPLPIRRPSQRFLANSNGDANHSGETGAGAGGNSDVSIRADSETIEEEQEQNSPSRECRPFTIASPSTNFACSSTANNLNANLDLEMPNKITQPAALLNVSIATNSSTAVANPASSRAPPTTASSVAANAESTSDEDDESSGDEQRNDEAEVSRSETTSRGSNSHLLGGATSASSSSINVVTTFAVASAAASASTKLSTLADSSRPMSPNLSHSASPLTSPVVKQIDQPPQSASKPQSALVNQTDARPSTQPKAPAVGAKHSASASLQLSQTSLAAPASKSTVQTPVAPSRPSKAAAKRVEQDIVAKPKSRQKADVDADAALQIEKLIREQLQLERGAAAAAAADAGNAEAQSRVSAKIQQLCKTLRRPRQKSVEEHFADVGELDEVEAPQADPNGPKSEGQPSQPLVGEMMASPSGLPRNLEMALQKYGTSQSLKQRPALSMLDASSGNTSNPKMVTLSYGKLWSRALIIAYQLSRLANAKSVASALGNASKTLPAGWTLKPGDRVAIALPNSDPLSFVAAWFGCLLASVVPVSVDLPVAVRRDASSRDAGFLLSSLQVRLALTTEMQLRTLPKKPTGEVETFRGWPPMAWCAVDACKSPPRDWRVPPRLKDDDVALIEQTVGKDGNVMGVTVTRQAMLQHCRTLHCACGYVEGETVVCVVDFKRELGLWHGVLTSVFAGMHCIFVPYAVMKNEPASWLKIVTKQKASVALVNSRDLHWSLLSLKDPKDTNLSALRFLLVADSANPWSLTSYDAFVTAFRSRGLREDALCTVAYSSEALTVSIRRPNATGASTNTGADGWSKRGVLSMQALSFGVVRAEAEIGPTSIALQDCGMPMPGATVCVAKLGTAAGQPMTLCRSDEIGELCISSGHTGNGYYSLDGLSSQVFRARLENDVDATRTFVRSGLIGFTSPNGLVFVSGSADGLMLVGGRKHNTDDLVATVLITEPTKFVYRGRIAVFSHSLLKDERVVVVAEQRPNCTDEEAFGWMSRVLHTVENVHQLSVYCVLLLSLNSLPRMPLGGVHIHETRRRYLEGSLHPINVLLCPHASITNLPKPRVRTAEACQPSSSATPATNGTQTQRLALATGRELDRMGTLHAGDSHQSAEGTELDRKNLFIHETLQFRAQTTPENVLFSVLNAKMQPAIRLTYAQLHERAERIAALLAHKDVAFGSHVALMLPAGVDLVAAFFGCLYAGCIAVPIRPPNASNLATTLRTCRLVVEVSHASAVLTQAAVVKLIKSKEAAAICDSRSWPILLDSDDLSRRSRTPPHRPASASELSYLDFAISANGTLAGVKCTHRLLATLCRAIKIQCELYPSRDVLLGLEAYSGLGFVLLVAAGVYCGHQTFMLSVSDLEANAGLWLSALSVHRIRDAFVSYGVLEMTTRLVGPRGVETLAQRGVSLSAMRSLAIVAEERPRVALLSTFTTLLRAVGLNSRAVSVSFGCRVNAAISLQSASAADCATVYVDLRALRRDRVVLVDRGAPHAVCLFECGELMPGVRVAISDTDTRAQCGEGQLGEIWVAADHNADGFYAVYGAQPSEAQQQAYATASSVHSSSSVSSGSRELNAPFKNHLTSGDTRTTFARTGYLGFLLRTGATSSSTGTIGGAGTNSRSTVASTADSDMRVFVVGALDEAIFVRGFRHYPIDIESTIVRAHKRIVEAAVFTLADGLLVGAVEFDGSESEALDLVPLVTNYVLEEHHLIVGVVVLLDPGIIPINSRGEKQRTHLRDSFLADQLDPIYVAYNM